MYRPEPTAQELAAVGLTPDDFEPEVVEVWPDNMPALDLWDKVGDQWRMGFNGPVALDLIPVFHEMDRMDLECEDYDSLLVDIKVMAAAAMGEMRSE